MIGDPRFWRERAARGTRGRGNGRGTRALGALDLVRRNENCSNLTDHIYVERPSIREERLDWCIVDDGLV
jgi:hypothetical protein